MTFTDKTRQESRAVWIESIMPSSSSGTESLLALHKGPVTSLIMALYDGLGTREGFRVEQSVIIY